MISRVTSSASYGTTASLRNVASGRSASAICAATRRACVSAATPASWSPLRNGVACAISAASVGNRCRSPAMVAWNT